MLKIRFLLFCALFLFCSVMWAKQVDSLLIVLNQTTQPKVKVELLLKISSEYSYINPEKQISYAQAATDLLISTPLRNDSLLAKSYLSAAGGYVFTGKNEKALQLIEQAEVIARKFNLPSQVCSALILKGLIYEQADEYQVAIQHYQEALTIAEQNNDQVGISTCANNMGVIYTKVKEYDKAYKLLLLNKEISERMNEPHGVAMSHYNIGRIEQKKGNIDSAFERYQSAFKIVDSLGIDYGKMLCNIRMGDIYVQKNQQEIAAQYYQIAYVIASKMQFYDKINEAIVGIAKWQYEQGNYKTSIQNIIEAFRYDTAKDPDTAYQLYKCLSENHEQLGDFERALFYQKLAAVQKDSTFSNQKMAIFTEMEYKFDSKKQETENRLLKAERLENESIIKQRGIVSIVSFVFLLLFFLLTWILLFQNRQKRKNNLLLEEKVKERTQHLESSNQKLVTLNKELEQFAYIASHDLKEPLRNIAGFASLLRRNIEKGSTENIVEYVGFIHQNTHQMSNLIEDILAYSKVGITSDIRQVTLAELLHQTYSDLQRVLNEKGGQIIFVKSTPQKSAQEIHLSSQLFVVFKNLVENGIKYNQSPAPTIKIGYGVEGNEQIITFQDNGIGIDEAYQEKIFEMFKRLHPRGEYSGSGIGLAICQKIVQVLNGKLSIAESSAAGTVFEVRLPLENKKETAKLSAELVV